MATLLSGWRWAALAAEHAAARVARALSRCSTCVYANDTAWQCPPCAEELYLHSASVAVSSWCWVLGAFVLGAWWCGQLTERHTRHDMHDIHARASPPAVLLLHAAQHIGAGSVVP